MCTQVEQNMIYMMISCDANHTNTKICYDFFQEFLETFHHLFYFLELYDITWLSTKNTDSI